jgi:hypothetical protein
MELVLLSLNCICLPIRPDLTSVLDLIGNRHRTYALVSIKGGRALCGSSVTHRLHLFFKKIIHRAVI